MITRQLCDRAKIQAYLETERDYAAYALGDLDAGFFEQCTWYVAEKSGAVRALTLVYSDFDPPILFLMGIDDGVAALLNGPVQIGRCFVTARPEHLAALERCYRWEHLDYMWRMVLRPEGFPKPSESCRRLDENDVDRLRALYAQSGGGDAFNPSQVTQGVFYGIEQDGKLISAAGTHLVSQTYSVGAIGNVVTHPDCRGRGYATLTTRAVCDELMRGERQIRTIVLNVRQDNLPAVRVYEKLGFVRFCPFYEGVIERR
jgi:ribosomal protein S18 acetylase RimI-like enzyme